MEVATIGLDISNHVFHIQAVDGKGQVTGRQRLGRGEILSFFSSLAPCLVGIEACATAHHWAVGFWMSDKQRTPCDYCKAKSLFGGDPCRECDGKGYRLVTDGRVSPSKFEKKIQE